MRALVDLEEGHIRVLDQLAAKQRRSRAALIREAITDYLQQRSPQAAEDAFGLWGERQVDGLTYQERIRGDW